MAFLYTEEYSRAWACASQKLSEHEKYKWQLGNGEQSLP